MFCKIAKSKMDGKKMTAIFYDKANTPIKTVHFGAAGYLDYTIAPHDEERKTRYIKRHQTSGDWTDYMSAGALWKIHNEITKS